MTPDEISRRYVARMTDARPYPYAPAVVWSPPRPVRWIAAVRDGVLIVAGLCGLVAVLAGVLG